MLKENMLALYNCTIIDGAGADPIKDKIILIKNDKIEKLVDGIIDSVPSEYRKINLEGNFVLPGFINSHVHNAYDESKLKSWLNEGVTTVRDMCATDPVNFAKSRDELNKDNNNARLVSATPMITTPGGYGLFHINSPKDAKIKVDNLIDMKADVIKIAIENDCQGREWNIISLEEIKSIVDTAHTKNKIVAVHISHLINLPLALEGGVDELAHMVVEDIPDNQINYIINKNIYCTPTLELWDGVSKMYGINYNQTTVKNLEKFYLAGGKIALGTDFEGFTCEFDKGFPITEVNLMKEANMSNMDIIISATKNAAYVCNMEKELGTLEPGKIADMLIIGSDPLSDINALLDRKMVIHNGHIIVNNYEISE